MPSHIPGSRRSRVQTAITQLPPGFAVGSISSSVAIISLQEGRYSFDPLTRHVNQAMYADRLTAFKEWAINHGLEVFSYSEVAVSFARNNHRVRFSRAVAIAWIVTDPGSMYGPDRGYVRVSLDDYASFTCSACGGQHPFGTFVCPNRGDTFVACPTCGSHEGDIIPQPGDAGWPSTGQGPLNITCRSCGSLCTHPGCTNRKITANLFCDDHAQHAFCHRCATPLEWNNGDPPPVSIPGRGYLCEGCDMIRCERCSRYRATIEHSSFYNMRVCDYCRAELLRLSTEEADQEDSSVNEIITIPGRESIRRCGIEIEGANGSGGGNELARALYNEGLVALGSMAEHGSGNQYGKVHVERDSSVDWELVIGPVNLAHPEDTKLVDSCVKIARNMVRNKTLGLDMRCGLHVHVGAERVSIPQAYNLSHIFTYIEDPFFRIGAARWPFHRGSQGSTYCAPNPKFGRKLDFINNQGGVRGSGRGNHYYALSFANYFNAKLRSCECGAVRSGVWDECTCPGLGKCTFEFRLFNTTVNPKKMTAYLALSQALVAKAIDMPEIRQPNEEFPGLEFNRRVFSEMTDSEQESLVSEWKPRLRFILTELPLTDQEKVAVRYCIKYSEIGKALSESDIDDLCSTRQEVAA